ncbi:MAG TPA: HTTM domain-containing protein [Luteibaculaceae bacterium]|nr:HTTM domain-containing protein [Luteibaculaceae bacterium]
MLQRLHQPSSSSPIVLLRIVFGLLLAGGLVRFALNGWIHDLYIAPRFHFTYFGFEWVKPLGSATYLIFLICFISSLTFAAGLWYRLSALVLFLSFTYIELMDKTTYLNHYYFVSLLCLLFIFLPADRGWTLAQEHKKNAVPFWTVASVKFFVGVVYVYAGLAKINSDWLLKAMPLAIWLPAHNDTPLIGPLLAKTWVAYAFSWFGCLYDLAIPFLLTYKPTRLLAFGLVLAFHLATSWLFPIGMFPYIMIGASLIFVDPTRLDQWLSRLPAVKRPFHTRSFRIPNQWALAATALLFAFHLILPWRYLCYPGELFWTEEGYRFSWRVMLIEKAGAIEYRVVDAISQQTTRINNSDYLTPLQEKMVATQPDMILQFAHILRDEFRKKGISNPQIYADTYVTLNGRRGRKLIDEKINLADINDSFAPKKWITPFTDEILGL